MEREFTRSLTKQFCVTIPRYPLKIKSTRSTRHDTFSYCFCFMKPHTMHNVLRRTSFVSFWSLMVILTVIRVL